MKQKRKSEIGNVFNFYSIYFSELEFLQDFESFMHTKL